MPDYARPQTLTEALRLLAGGEARLLAGGTDLYPGAGARLAGPVIDLATVAGLAGVQSGPGLRIGAATTWTMLAEASLPPALRALQQAAKQVGGRQVQNTGTIGGNICNASPAADGVPPLLALGAKVELASTSGTRRLALMDFLRGPRRTALGQGEVLTAILIPDSGLQGRSAFVKLGARSHLVISIVMVAARLVVRAGRVTEAAVAVGSCAPVAVRLPAVEAALRDAPVSEVADRIRAEDVTAALAPIDDVRATAAYRREAAVELVRRAVAEAVA
ncbi:xanthine dehydrogenase family protein subunit M [Tabrizicola sp.]|uniref:FAD binding domain-containing protein n=1 Tax=Tabrizicola sp. TaxID=2005166 RepID=UPI002732FFF5|nr:xanthine dehydrogenase family protein subunit M [Tabrizicola sp.]MDP3196766.1 xanthine dehydrogenase family protein subunit M [Tabrizicola sp.]